VIALNATGFTSLKGVTKLIKNTLRLEKLCQRQLELQDLSKEGEVVNVDCCWSGA
jgi:hypothetical protein